MGGAQIEEGKIEVHERNGVGGGPEGLPGGIMIALQYCVMLGFISLRALREIQEGEIERYERGKKTLRRDNRTKSLPRRCKASWYLL